MSHRIRLANNGPAILEGDLEIVGADGEIRRAQRASICRCGESSRKPYCDGAHKTCGYVEPGRVGTGKVLPAPEGLVHLRASVKPNGSIRVEGPFRLENAAGELILESGAVSLCRCGKTQNPPFCDGSHKACGFNDPGILPPL
jgi:CDGSH-type Zn-finger protein